MIIAGALLPAQSASNPIQLLLPFLMEFLYKIHNNKGPGTPLQFVSKPGASHLAYLEPDGTVKTIRDGLPQATKTLMHRRIKRQPITDADLDKVDRNMVNQRPGVYTNFQASLLVITLRGSYIGSGSSKTKGNNGL
jgi:hypothetical protein